MISQGAEAIVYSDGGTAVKKRVKKSYRHPVLDARLRRERTRSEAKIITAAKSNGINTPTLVSINEIQHTISVSFIKGKQLKNASCNYTLVGMELAKLHNAGIAHGDFTTSNVMISGGKPVIIDFGLSSFTQKIEDYAVDLDLFSKTVSEKQFASFLRGYKQRKTNAQAVLSQLTELESRGRYKT
ncbi:MAG: KEOPS complex kinase/ATPase Bud32 [Candidatus Micrarchaeota archaeon]